jgi:hypothetical protein
MVAFILIDGEMVDRVSILLLLETITFVYTETTAFGCVASCEFVIVVNPLPVFYCPAYGPFCEGDDPLL